MGTHGFRDLLRDELLVHAVRSSAAVALSTGSIVVLHDAEHDARGVGEVASHPDRDRRLGTATVAPAATAFATAASLSSTEIVHDLLGHAHRMYPLARAPLRTAIGGTATRAAVLW